MKVQVFMLNQDDPSKCTAAKLVKFGIAKQVRKASDRTMILDPFAEKIVLRIDRQYIDSITAIDCSWEFAQKTFRKKFGGLPKRLPPLLAGNPVNYSKIAKLTTAEAIAGALYIMNFKDLADSILNKFKWGHTFFELNQDLLREYSNAETDDQMSEISREYGLAA
ncbi:MAG: DUF367 family protein [Thaumarchaeota archaeon]|nr:MAG: DUF367 family protein [Nitrososphaerota archaeon]